MTADEIAGFHHRWYRPSNLVFSVAGAVDHDLVAAAIDARFDGAVDGERPDRVPPGSSMTGLVEARRPIEQVHLALGWRGVTALDGDRVPLRVMNHALGDGP